VLYYLRDGEHDLKKHVETINDILIKLPFRPREIISPQMFLLLISHWFTLIIAMATIFILTLLNPFHWYIDVPLAYWSLFWPCIAFLYVLTYPGIVVTCAYIAKVLKRKSVYEPIPMLLSHGLSWVLTQQIGIWFSEFITDGVYSYPIWRVLFNVAGAEIAMHIFYPVVRKTVEDAAKTIEVSKEELGLDRTFWITKNNFKVADVLYAKSEGHYLSFRETSRSRMIPGKIKDVSMILPRHIAISPHRSYWIMRHAIKHATYTNAKLTITMKDDHAIVISRVKTSEVRKWLIECGIAIT